MDDPNNCPVGYDRGHKSTCEWPGCPGGIDCEGLSLLSQKALVLTDETSGSTEPADEGREVNDDAQKLGLVAEGNQMEGGQASGDLLARLEHLRASVITAPEERAVRDCISIVIACQPREDR